MGVPSGWKDFTSSVLTSEEVNNYLMSQAVMVFDSSAARTLELGTPAEGMVTYLRDTNSVEYYNGSVWGQISGGVTDPMNDNKLSAIIVMDVGV